MSAGVGIVRGEVSTTVNRPMRLKVVVKMCMVAIVMVE